MLPQRKQFVPVSPEGTDPEIGTDWPSEAHIRKATFKHLDDASDNIWLTIAIDYSNLNLKQRQINVSFTLEVFLILQHNVSEGSLTGPNQIWENFNKLVKIFAELSSVIGLGQTSTPA